MYIVKVRNGLSAHRRFVGNAPGVCNKHEGTNGRGGKGRGLVWGGWVSVCVWGGDCWECPVFFQVEYNGVR